MHLNWSDDDVRRFSEANATGGLRAVVSLAQDLVAARGGTMTAEALQAARSWVGMTEPTGSGHGSSLLEHITAQGARIAALEADARRCCPRDHNADGNCDRHTAGTVARLEQHITDLEKSLEDVRKERDEFATACREALGPHRSTGKPADVMLLHKDLDAARAFSVEFGNERDAAAADSAALASYVREQAMVACEEETRAVPSCGDCATCRARQLTSVPHPGAALLERMKRLEKERDEAYRMIDESDSEKELKQWQTALSPYTPESARERLSGMRALEDERDALRRELEHFRKKALERFGH